jgi:hypothetical protein
MFALYAISHDGLTQDDISLLPAMPGRSHLMRWLETGGECRLANSEYVGDLRELRRQLHDQGLKTEIHEARELRPPPAVAARSDAFPAAVPAADSGVHQYRQMMAEIEGNRSTREHKGAVALKIRPVQATVLAAITLLGIVAAFAL